jgi:hypothetical protein
MPQPQPLDLNVPLLTEVVHGAASPDGRELDALLAEVQTKLASRAFTLTDDLLRSAFAEMQAALYERVSSQLRRELPELIDATLREHFDTRNP